MSAPEFCGNVLKRETCRHECDEMIFGAFYDPFVQVANKQLRETVTQKDILKNQF